MSNWLPWAKAAFHRAKLAGRLKLCNQGAGGSLEVGHQQSSGLGPRDKCPRVHLVALGLANLKL